jgi:hypothetical protein
VEHKALEPLVGRWTAKVTMWQKPGDKPQESTGTSEMIWVLDNHFIKQEYHGTMMGKPFEGIGYTGMTKSERSINRSGWTAWDGADVQQRHRQQWRHQRKRDLRLSDDR